MKKILFLSLAVLLLIALTASVALARGFPGLNPPKLPLGELPPLDLPGKTLIPLPSDGIKLPTTPTPTQRPKPPDMNTPKGPKDLVSPGFALTPKPPTPRPDFDDLNVPNSPASPGSAPTPKPPTPRPDFDDLNVPNSPASPGSAPTPKPPTPRPNFPDQNVPVDVPGAPKLMYFQIPTIPDLEEAPETPITPGTPKTEVPEIGTFVTSEGPLFIMFRDNLTEGYEMFTPMDLSIDGNYVFRLVSNAMHVVGAAKVTVKNGMVTVHPQVFPGVTLGEGILVFFPDFRVVETIDPSMLEGVVFSFDLPVNVISRLGVDAKVLMYINCRVSYNSNLESIQPFSLEDPAYLERMYELVDLMD